MRRTLLLAAAAATGAALAACETTPSSMMMAESLAPPHAPIEEGKPVTVVAHPDQLSLLESDDPELAANKRLVHEMWRGFLTASHLEVGEEMLAEDYMQHNPMASTGRAAVLDFFRNRERMEEIPDTIPGLVSMIAEDDLVVLALVREMPDPRMEGETYTTTWFDMFRIDDGEIVEHWDAAVLPTDPNFPFPPPESEGGTIRVRGAGGYPQLQLLEADDPQLAANKRVVFDVWRNIVDAGREEVADDLLAEDYIQHNPNAATGRAGFQAYFATRPDLPLSDYTQWPIVAVVAEGDLVAIAFAQEEPHPTREGDTYTHTWFDMFRVVDGRLVEHWDIATLAPPPAE